jgi:hypothetical protein
MRLIWAGPLVLMLSACAPDKNLHMGVGAVGAGVVTHATGDWRKGCAAALALGVAKEGYDALGYGQVEAMDALATAAGCLVWTIEF